MVYYCISTVIVREKYNNNKNYYTWNGRRIEIKNKLNRAIHSLFDITEVSIFLH